MSILRSLTLAKSIHAYRLTRSLTKTVVTHAFSEASKARKGNYLARDIREEYTTATGIKVKYSLISFRIEAQPPFLKGARFKELKYAYLLVIELDDALVISKRYVDSPESYFSDFIDEYDYTKFCHLHGEDNPEYERVTMRNMSISNSVIRSRMLEAKSLNGILPSTHSSRAIATGFRVRVDHGTYTLTPSTSRVSKRDQKCSFEELVAWSFQTKEDIKSAAPSNDFVASFATPVRLDIIRSQGIRAEAIFIDLGELESDYEAGLIEISDGDENPLTQQQIRRLFDQLKSPLIVAGDLLRMKGVTLKGRLSYNRTTITIRNNIARHILIHSRQQQPLTLESYINKNKPFTVVFNTPVYSCFSRSCFEDRRLLGNLDSFLRIFDDSYDFSSVTSEKGKSLTTKVRADFL